MTGWLCYWAGYLGLAIEPPALNEASVLTYSARRIFTCLLALRYSDMKLYSKNTEKPMSAQQDMLNIIHVAFNDLRESVYCLNTTITEQN